MGVSFRPPREHPGEFNALLAFVFTARAAASQLLWIVPHRTANAGIGKLWPLADGHDLNLLVDGSFGILGIQ